MKIGLQRTILLTILTVLLSTQLMTERALAQGIPSDGRDFYIGYMPGLRHSAIFSGVTESYWVLIGSYADNNPVTINYFDDNGNELQGSGVVLMKGRCAQLALDRQRMGPTKPGEVAEYKAAHIKSKYPISVQCYSQGSSTGGLLQSIPTPALGKSYVIASWFDNPIQNNPGYLNRDSASSEFMIIAPYDHTTVSYTPASTTNAGVVGVNSGYGSNGKPHTATVSLNRGQIFWVRSLSVDPSYDISGSLVTADKPIAVLGGHERALLGDPSGVWFSLDNDVRDLMIEQMTPIEDWETEYPSIPFVAPPNVTRLLKNGTGEMYRIYTDQASDAVNMWAGGNISPYTLQLSAYQNPVAAYNNVIDPVDILSNNGKKIYVVMYDYFQGQHDIDPGEKGQGGKGVNPQDETTYTCPNEMNVVPPRRWRKNAVWKIPAHSDYKNAQFINVITWTDSLNTLMLSTNGLPPKKLTSMSTVGQFTIPNHPEWTGVRYRLPAGDYALTANVGFAVYSYGRTEGQYKDGWGYAAPCGEAYGSNDESNKPKMRFTPDCASWNVTITDSLVNDDGLADIVLLDDPQGVYARPARVSFNTRLNPTDPQFVAGDPKVSFRVEVVNPLQDAYAAVYAIDRSGNDTVFEFRYSAPKISVTPASASMLNTLVTVDSCTRLVFHNNGTKNSQPIVVTATSLELDRGDFTLGSTTPALPAKLMPGDSIVVNVCYSPKDTGTIHFDSVLFHADCLADTVPVRSSGVTPIIVATDADFGTVLLGQKSCKDVTVRNIGNAPLVIDKNWVLHNMTEFTFNDDAKLPITLEPGESTTLNFCYTPHKVGTDSSSMDWGNNLGGIFVHHNKDYSTLLGRGVKPGVQWDRITQAYPVECDQPDTVRIWLYNNNTATENVTQIVVTGPDNAEFRSVRNQFNYSPFGGFPVSPGDSVWTDIVFTPNLAKGFGPRSATLIAHTLSGNDPYVTLTATLTHADLTVDQNSIDFGLSLPNVPVVKTFKVTNPGTAPLHITQVSVSDPAFTVTGINVGDVIPPNVTVTATVTGVIMSAGTVSATVTINGATTCVQQKIVALTLKANTLSVAGTGNNYPTTFTCQQNSGITVASNTGTRDVILREVDIIGAGSHPDAADFNFADGSQVMPVDRTLHPGDTAQFHVVYHPSQVKFSSAIIEYTWDTVATPGSSWTLDQYLNGTGDAILDTLSAVAPDTKPYTAKTGDFFDVPLHLTQKFPVRAASFGVRFEVTYRRDLFNNLTIIPPSGFSIVGSVKSTDDTAGNETATIMMMSGVPIDNIDQLGTLHMRLMVARDLSSTFKLSNIQFLGQDSLPLCYVTSTDVPATFVPQDLCGDPTTRHFLQTGVVDASITQVSPNPAFQSAQIEYQVREQDLPVTIEVYNLLGQNVQTILKNVPHDIGAYRATFDPSELPSGTYTIRLATPSSSMSRTIVVNK